MGDKSQIRLLIVDDHPLFRAGLGQIMEYEDHIQIVGQSEDGEQAIEDTRRLSPDVILLDVNLPGDMNGMQVARQIKSERPTIPIIILTAHHDSEQTVHAISVGASSYCPKDVRPEELIKTIDDVKQGYYVIDSTRMTKEERDTWLDERIRDLSPYAIDGDEHYSPLSPREIQILKNVTAGMSNKEIAYKLGISQQTVKNHMTSVLKKLNVDDRTQAAIKAIRRGWVRVDSSSANE